MAKIYIIDVTNRDGVQTSRICLSKLEKTMINIYLDQLGVFQSEFGFPFTKHEINYLNANLALAKKGGIKKMRLSGWLRAVPQDVNAAFDNCPRLQHVNLSISTSDIMIKHKFQGKYGRADILKNVKRAVKAAKTRGAKSIGVNAEDASRSNMDYLVKFARTAHEAGADRIRYCDTLGKDSPFSIYDRVSQIAQAVPIAIEIHCHNDLGMAVGSSVAGAKAAVDNGRDAYINTCINGIGERAGNADLVSVILAIRYGAGLNAGTLDKRIKLRTAYRLCKYASYALGIPIPINQPGLGANAFAHESGIHADGALKNRKNYELYDFHDLGRGEPEVVETGRRITVGEYSGIKGFRNVYERMAIKFDNDAQAAKILELVRYANIHNQKPLVQEELRFIAEHPDIAKQIFSMEP